MALAPLGALGGGAFKVDAVNITFSDITAANYHYQGLKNKGSEAKEEILQDKQRIHTPRFPES